MIHIKNFLWQNLNAEVGLLTGKKAQAIFWEILCQWKYRPGLNVNGFLDRLHKYLTPAIGERNKSKQLTFLGICQPFWMNERSTVLLFYPDP